ncbi:hypothetical protein N431DRAFT_437394 [Stipitochalara longipes BDJ]|nr:hypothetical protein N431DRAFT_437394 [Stipitochalara longipes BDJ]
MSKNVIASWDYLALPRDDTLSVSAQSTKSKFMKLRTPLGYSIAAISCFLLGAFISFEITTRQPNQGHSSFSLESLVLSNTSCGHSRAEALQKNCFFDVMSFSWLLPACADPELSEQFLKARNWTWFTELSGNDTMSVEEVKTGKFSPLYVTHEYHSIHCTYMFRKFHRAAILGKGFDTYIWDYGHTTHCETWIFSNVTNSEIDSGIQAKYPFCLEF